MVHCRWAKPRWTGFFLISGYLVTQSLLRSKSIADYFKRRILRIVPGYMVSFLLCVVLVAPFAGNSAVLSLREMAFLLPQMLLLSQPDVSGVFTGLPYPLLNGTMWTIGYEFRCYVITAVLGLLGILGPRYRILLVVGVAVLLALNATGALTPEP